MQAAEIVAGKLSELLERGAEAWKGHEQLAILEIARALDADAYYLREAGVSGHSGRQRADLRSGVSYALRPFVRVAASSAGAVPWANSSQQAHAWISSYLEMCSTIARVQRLLALERHGLSRSTVLSDKHILIEVVHGAEEITFQAFTAIYRGHIPESAFLKRRPGWLQRRMYRYVDYDRSYGIRYENDRRIADCYKSAATAYGMRFFEGEALPPSAQIGGRTFAEWCQACDEALGRAVCHTDFAASLASKSRCADLRSAITTFAFKRDVSAVWEQLGLRRDRVESTLQALTLDPHGLDAWERDFEPPAPFYVPYGRDCLLMPSFGGLANPYYAMFRHLRAEFRSEWDSAVDGREDMFRDDIAREFSSDRYLVLPKSVWLRRADGSRITDIDAVVLDRKTGSLGLFQLKWQDPFGVSLRERASRAKNMASASDWVERVSDWVAGRSSALLCSELGFPGQGGSQAPAIFVMSRYIARFTSQLKSDSRVTWLGWPEFVACMRNAEMTDPLSEISEVLTSFSKCIRIESSESSIAIRDVRVDLFIGSSS